jgi:hypothetical protein
MKTVQVNHYVHQDQWLLNFHLVIWKYLTFIQNCILFAIEPPGSPGQPEIDELTNNTATLTWDKPSSDGGEEY